jgi:hypothetical protein
MPNSQPPAAGPAVALMFGAPLGTEHDWALSCGQVRACGLAQIYSKAPAWTRPQIDAIADYWSSKLVVSEAERTLLSFKGEGWQDGNR